MPDVKVYDANEVTLMVGGLLIDSGFDDGEFLAFEAEADAFSVKVGTDGEVTRSKTNNKFNIVNVNLMQTSSGNSKLAALYLLDDKGVNGAGIGAFLVKDRSGTAVYSGKCWIQAPPNPKFDREATPRTWKLGVVLDTRFDGGS